MDATRITALHLERSRLVQMKAEAILELSAASFNQPRVHDSAHSSPSFRRWRECSERAHLIEAEIARIERGLDR